MVGCEILAGVGNFSIIVVFDGVEYETENSYLPAPDSEFFEVLTELTINDL